MSQSADELVFDQQPRERRIVVVFEIAPEGSCFMDHLEGEVSDVEMHFNEGDCVCDVTLCRADGNGECLDVVHHSGPVCQNCPGTVFSQYDLVPRFLKRTDDRFVIRTFLPSEHRLPDLVDDLRRVSRTVRILRILNVHGRDIGTQTASIDLTRLTAKQRATLERATERGYYDSPRAVSLVELADEFGVSESAMSQRLARAERTVMEHLFSA